jgi:hypothetical protein
VKWWLTVEELERVVESDGGGICQRKVGGWLVEEAGAVEWWWNGFGFT